VLGGWLAETPAATLEDAAIVIAYLGTLGGRRTLRRSRCPGRSLNAASGTGETAIVVEEIWPRRLIRRR